MAEPSVFPLHCLTPLVRLTAIATALATGPVDPYNRIPTSMQVVWYSRISVRVHIHYAQILHNSACLHVLVHVIVKSLITSTWVRHSAPLSWPHSPHSAKIPANRQRP